VLFNHINSSTILGSIYVTMMGMILSK